MAIRRRGTGWQADFMHQGVRYRGQFGTLNAAETWDAEARLALKKGLPVPGGATTTVETGREKLATLGALLDYTTNLPEPKGWKGCDTERQLVRRGQEAVEFFGPSTRADAIGDLEIDTYIHHLQTTGNSGGTVNRKTAALSKLLTVAKRIGVIRSRPEITRVKETGARLRFLDEDEQTRLVDAFDRATDAGLAAFLLDTGFRVSEALTLAWASCGDVRVTVEREHAKNNTARSVPLTKRAKEILDAEFDEQGRSGPGPFSRVVYHSYRHRFEKARDRAGLGKDVTIHTLRHTTASRLVAKGVDLYRVMTFMGHRDIKVTMGYAKLAPAAIDELSKELEPA